MKCNATPRRLLVVLSAFMIASSGAFHAPWPIDPAATADEPDDVRRGARKVSDPNAWHGRDYIPAKQYACLRTETPLVVDGRLAEDAWGRASWTSDFVDIEGDARPKPRFRTRAKMLWDDRYFYIAAELEEPHVWGSLTKHDSIIYHDNDFEVFMDRDGDNHNYAEYEINALETGFDLRLPKPYKDGGGADIPWPLPGLKSAVHVDGTLNDPSDVDKRWTVELAIPWEPLVKLDRRSTTPKTGERWRVNFSRVEWRHRVVDGKYLKTPKSESPEDNWVWSPQYAINMHRPETWGYVQLCGSNPKEVKLERDGLGPARFLLHKVYYAQRAYRKQHGRYANKLDALQLGALEHSSLAAPLRLTGGGQAFQAVAAVRKGERTTTLTIRGDSRITTTTKTTSTSNDER